MAFNTALFARMPKNKIAHSKFKRPFIHVGTAMHGDIFPIYCKLVSPGEIIKDKIYGNIRMSQPLTPLYSSIKFSANAFFVPLRLLWSHWVNFFGENKSGTTPVTPGTYTIPSAKLNNSDSWNQVHVHTVSHYLRKPLYKGGTLDGNTSSDTPKVSILKERAYWSIINRWYRAEQFQNPIVVDTGDSSAIAVKNGNNLALSSACQKCLKDFDYFTTMTRYPQFGPDVTLPLGSVAPVIVKGTNPHSMGGQLYFDDVDHQAGVNDMQPLVIGTGSNTKGKVAADLTAAQSPSDLGAITKSNLFADLSNAASATIDELYLAMAAQAWFHNANYGSRYFEALEIHYSVTNPSLVLEEPEHIGEAKCYIQVQQVLSTAGATNDSSTKLGQPGANSSTNVSFEFPRHSFGEWGYLMVLGNTYHERYYSAGVLREDLYKDLFDFFFPEFSNIGDQGVFEKELFFASKMTDPESILGFQEAWSEMRYTPNQVSGLFDPYVDSGNSITGYTAPLKGWVLTEKWASAPTLSESFLLENRDAIKDCLVSGSNGPDYLFTFYVDETTLNEVPLYSIPGLPGRGRGII